MRKYILGLAALALVGLFGSASDSASDSGGEGKAAQKSDKDKLQGTWVVVSGEVMGKPFPEEVVKKMEMKIIFSGDKVTVKKGMKDDPDEPEIKLDATKSPKTIDVTDTKGNDKGKTQKGIYTLDGDKLTIAVSRPMADRPTTFKTELNSQFLVLVFKREKK